MLPLNQKRISAVSFLPGFALTGFLLSLLGASLPGWNYHMTDSHSRAGWLFLAVSAGVLSATELRRRALPLLAAAPLCLSACALAAIALVSFSILPQPVGFAAQCVGWFAIGLSAGLLNVSLFESIRDLYVAQPASTVIHAGIFFGAGCLSSAAALAAAFRWGFVSQILPALALVPILFGLLLLRRGQWTAEHDFEPPIRPALSEFSRPGALVFALLLLFQSGSEWTVAGWLPLFLTHRLGVSPETALWMLALYWLALLLGRIANIYLLAHLRHGRLLFWSAAAALLGCLLLGSTDNILGAVTSTLLLGGGFAAVYPLLAEKMGNRFPEYRPGVFNGIFSAALAGGFLFPFAAGLLAQNASLSVIMAIPAIGTFLVVILLLVLWLESKVTGR